MIELPSIVVLYMNKCERTFICISMCSVACSFGSKLGSSPKLYINKTDLCSYSTLV